MELTFTGRGAAFNPKEGNTNAFFIENNILFLVDCGESMFATLIEHNILSNIQEIYVLISHTHSDHCGSLGSIGLYSQFVLGKTLKIVVPHNEAYIQSIKDLMNIFGNTTQAYEIVYEEEIDHKFETFDKVRYDLTQHDFSLTCYSFIFETKQGAIFYSADTRVIDNLVHFLEKYQQIDKIYMEVTNIQVVGDVHLYIEDLIAIMNEELKEKIYMMHLRNDECIQRVLLEGFKIVECIR
ncbi:MAG: MBL fold metallo-hydrolase [Erysipelotrichales bacterium]|nr:MBL fold metallo-hydrolase [Erysipelotrichales bacterium]